MADEPKIFIDEGWKAQVQREREAAAKQATDVSTTAGAVPESPNAPAAEMQQLGEDDPIPANFTALIASLATQAMMALGVMAAPGTREVMVDLDAAKFSLDTLAMLHEKTQGNLTEEEAAHLQEAVVELTRIYDARLQQFQEQALRQAGVDPANLKGL